MWYAVTTGLTPHEALQQATAYFGRGGVGLHAIAQTPQRLVFQGGGGHVASGDNPARQRRGHWRLVGGILRGNGSWGRSAIGPAGGPETPGCTATPRVPHSQQCAGGGGRSIARSGVCGAPAW